MRAGVRLSLWCCLGLAPFASAMAGEVKQAVAADYPHLEALFRHFHANPELSLQEVESVSRQEFKASVLGAYERGERAISVPRLQRLARFYSVPVDQLLPYDNAPDFGVEPDIVIDLTDRPSRALTTPANACVAAHRG